MQANVNRRLSVRPYLNEYDNEYNPTLKCGAAMFEYDESIHDYEVSLDLNVKNIGLGPLVNFRVISLSSASSSFKVDEQPIHSDIKCLEHEGVMKLDVSYSFQQLYTGNTYRTTTQFEDLLDNVYTQVIVISVHRKSKNGEFIKASITKVEKPTLLSS